MLKGQLPVLDAGLNPAPEADLHLLVFPAHFPHIIILQPVVRQLDLITIYNLLLKQAVFIADSAAVSRILQGSQGIQEAGGQPPEPAVAKPGIRLFLLHIGQIES
ncbi:hypothetical protein D3C73_974150 [compost metagenome]